MITGGCLCGAVGYSVEGPFLYAGYCHCTRCRTASGSAFSTFAGVGKDGLRIMQGEGSITVFKRNEDNLVSRCSVCGSRLFSLVRNGQFFHVAMGTLLDDPGIRPSFHIFVGSKAPWHKITDELPQYPGLPPELPIRETTGAVNE